MSARKEQVVEYIHRLMLAGKRLELRRADRWPNRAGLESAESPDAGQRELAAQALSAIGKRRRVAEEQSAALEAIILPKIRPVLDVIDGDFRTSHPLWLKLNDDAQIRKGLLAAIPSIGRLELPGHPEYPYGGTGFIVGPNLLMTNRHVAAIFAMGIGTRRVGMRPGFRAGIDFRRELARPTGPTLPVTRVVMIHPYWDMALLEVEGLPVERALTFSQLDPGAFDGVEVAAIGYPAFDSRNDEDEQDDLFNHIFGVKRLQPGTVTGRQDTASFGKSVPAMRHNCSTLGGNSGSAIIDLSNGEVIALHFGGRFHVTNFGVPGCELARDPRVLEAGVKFSGPLPQGDIPWANWWDRADRDDGWVEKGEQRAGPVARRVGQTAVSCPPVHVRAGEVMIPLYISVRLGAPGDSATGAELDVAVGDGDASVERLAIPWHDASYDGRSGYDETFLGERVRPPQAADPAVVAPTKDGSGILHYENFSIVMHAARRMALFTASSVTAEKELKRPDPRKKYSRRALSGLGDNDQERWFPDPRLEEKYQLPDIFYTRDEGAFDKGHLVRREDVAWGETYDALRRANGDTYHVTNCSPQVAGFNRSNLGEDNWGDLENHVLSGAVSERYCQFAGPVLDERDEVFVGAGGGRVRLRVRIPSRYWKVIVVQTDNARLASYGFLLEQDLSDVPLEEEFVVPANFTRFMEPLVDLSARTGVAFPEEVLSADQYERDDGRELALRVGIRRRSRAEGVMTEAIV